MYVYASSSKEDDRSQNSGTLQAECGIWQRFLGVDKQTNRYIPIWKAILVHLIIFFSNYF